MQPIWRLFVQEDQLRKQYDWNFYIFFNVMDNSCRLNQQPVITAFSSIRQAHQL